MRYFIYVDREMGPIIVSEKEVFDSYYPYWRNMLRKTCDEALIDEYYSFEDCLDEWMQLYNARPFQYNQENK